MRANITYSVDVLNQDDSEKQDTLEEDGMQAQGEE